ncbi:Chemotaxis response regulator protein-glutamate methylesterase 1 [Bienertia sinuspersici]
MKKRLFNPHLVGGETQSPEGAKEVRDMLQRLVEIDNESREILSKVFSLLEKDEKLENYVKKRIDDPKVSRMWQLVEQVLACQEEDTNFDDYSAYDEKSIKEIDEIGGELRVDRFKVKNIASGANQGAGSNTTAGSK